MTKDDIIAILESEDGEETEKLFSQAREVRDRETGKKIFAYGFVYFSTYCRNNCNFCYFRRSNEIERYRKSETEIINHSEALVKSGVNLIDLTMGEDMAYHSEEFETVLRIIKHIKKELKTPAMISPGVVPHRIIERFAEAGADFFALYQETHNRELFAKLRVGQSYDERMNAKLYAKRCGMNIEEGLLAGVGESNHDIADSLIVMREIGARQLRVMSFVPQKGSPMEECSSPDRLKELKIIALMRLLYPKALIPASLDVDGIIGLRDRINAGANLITSIIPPASGLMGVAHSTMDVDTGGRTVEEASLILNEMGLRVATADEFKAFL